MYLLFLCLSNLFFVSMCYQYGDTRVKIINTMWQRNFRWTGKGSSRCGVHVRRMRVPSHVTAGVIVWCSPPRPSPSHWRVTSLWRHYLPRQPQKPHYGQSRYSAPASVYIPLWIGFRNWQIEGHVCKHYPQVNAASLKHKLHALRIRSLNSIINNLLSVLACHPYASLPNVNLNRKNYTHA